MIKTLTLLARAGKATQNTLFPNLPGYSRGLPMVTQAPCVKSCGACAAVCPTEAVQIQVQADREANVTIDRGLCIACGRCESVCVSGVIVADRRTDIATISREHLIESRQAQIEPLHVLTSIEQDRPFKRSLHVRVVSTGDSASDLEIAASDNPIFDAGRFGIQIVASPRFADALVVTGPVAHGMREPLQRCYDAMPSPRLVIAVGAAAISGGLYSGGYASASGVDSVLPVDAYVPGAPPHPWSILHGLMLAMGHKAVKK